MDKVKAYGTFEVKSFDDEKREVTGIASTIETDRYGDIVDPSGAKFAEEIPFLWQHNHGSPIGWATLKAGKKEITFSAKLAKIDEEGELKSLLDKAWQSIKLKLVKGISIGFRAIEYSFIENGGIHFKEIEIYEISAVTIPAHAGAGISTIKAYANNTIPLIPASVSKSAGADSGIRLIKAGIPIVKQ